MIYVYAALLATVYVVMRRFDYYGMQKIPRTSPDGLQYMAAGEGKLLIVPISLRWLPPAICKNDRMRWQIMTLLSLVAMGPAVAWYVDGSASQKLLAAALLMGLPGVVRVHVILPVMVDAPAMLTMVLGAAALNHHVGWLAALCIMLAGATRETAPIFMAIAARSFIPLFGLAPVWVRYLLVKNKAKGRVDAPFTVVAQRLLVQSKLPGIEAHKHHWFDYKMMLVPWGVTLLASLNMDPWLAVGLGLAYAQLFYAVDVVRMYQWAFPLMIAATVPMVPVKWMLPLAIGHLFLVPPVAP